MAKAKKETATKKKAGKPKKAKEASIGGYTLFCIQDGVTQSFAASSPEAAREYVKKLEGASRIQFPGNMTLDMQIEACDWSKVK